jgi:polygalacturonase
MTAGRAAAGASILAVLALFPAGRGAGSAAAPAGAFNIRDYGATGMKTDDAQASIQKAVDACSRAGGGMVYVPPGEYSTGTIHLRSGVRFHVEAGATLYSAKRKEAFDKDALFYGEDVDGITLEGRGTIDGQGAYERRLKGDFHDDFIYPNQVEMEKLGWPLVRSFPRSDQFGKLVLLLRCRDVRIAGLSFVDSPSWTMHLYGCRRTVIDGVFIRSSLADGVWADGIDPDGCQDLRIANSTIETGDDALVFYSMNWFGPALPCENITVTNCRLSSASSAIKFCDGNMNAVRNVTISNCVITKSNRGLAFMNFDGGVVENVVISGLIIDCVRHEWFWWGDGEPFHFNIRKRSEVHRNFKPQDDRPAGVIRNVKISNVIARGMGASVCEGHPDSALDGITMENVRLAVAHDPGAPYDKTVNALIFRKARNLRLRNIEIAWEPPLYRNWRSALVLDDVENAGLSGIEGRQAGSSDAPAILFRDVRDARIRDCRAPAGTRVFFGVSGPRSEALRFSNNDTRAAQTALASDADVPPSAIK